MISVSSIKTYMYCPLKLYFQNNLKDELDKNQEDTNYFISKSMKDLRIDLQDILYKNLRHITRNMPLNEIEKTLSQQIENHIKTTFEIIENIDLDNDESNIIEELNENINLIEPNNTTNIPNIPPTSNITNTANTEIPLLISNITNPKTHNTPDSEKLKENIINETNLNIKILALKVNQSMKYLDKDGSNIQELFFPTCMYNYLIRDVGLNLIGTVDKIEVNSGKYYPISLKSNLPPMKGVWDSDLMEIVANTLLIEQEFNTQIFVGFVDYLKIGERKAVIVDTNLRKSFFKVLNSVNRIIEKGDIPTVKPSLKKCQNCNYKEQCESNNLQLK